MMKRLLQLMTVLLIFGASAEALATGPHALGENGCVACHGQAADHPASSDGLMLFAGEKPVDRRSACQGCHSDQHSSATSNPHDRAGLACDDCHSVHEVDAEPVVPPGFATAYTVTGLPSCRPVSS